jgi:hypothetical protein
MTHLPNEQPVLDLEKLVKQIIVNAEDIIKEKYQQTDNSWMACYKDLLTSIKMYFDLLGHDQKKFTLASNNLKELINKSDQLADIYPDKGSVLPEDIKQELIASLNIFDHRFNDKITKQAA